MGVTEHPQAEAATGTKRKLAAILHADVVDYSRHMEADEVGTHDRLMAHRRLAGQVISAHSGRIVATAGDAILADFPSVIEALSAAVEIQAAVAERNAALTPEQRLQFRIGINLGDVIVDGDDIFGDGVNVAARVEALADPGGVAISGAVYDQVRNKVDFALQDRGTHRVKNIADPVRVYAIGAEGTTLTRRRRAWSRDRVMAASLAVLLVAAGIAAAWVWGPIGAGDDRAAPASGDVPAPAALQPDRPTIAVLPFENRSGGAEDEYFSDGVTEDVIADLGRFSDLLVLSWNAVAPYKNRTVPPEELSRDLNVRYIVGGALRRADDRLRVTVQLTDAERGVLLWSERYDEELKDVFAVQDQITRQVVGALAARVTDLEQERAFEKPTEELGAYDLVLRARDLLRGGARAGNLEARVLLEQAIEIDPRYSEAHVGLGWTHLYDLLYGWTEWPHRALDRAQQFSDRAIALDEREASAHALLAYVLRFRQEYDRAEREIAQAIELNPNDAVSHAIHGSLMLYTGRPGAAATALELALRLDPRLETGWVVNLAEAYYYLERYEDAVRVFESAERGFEDDPSRFAVLAAANAQLGRREAADQAVARLRRVSPFFNARAFAATLADPALKEHLLDGLSKAGLK